TVFESEGQDFEVTDRSGEASLSGSGGGYRLALPASQGFMYVRKPDPYEGRMALGAVVRSDAKAIAPENVWLSRTRNPETKRWDLVQHLRRQFPGQLQRGLRAAVRGAGPAGAAVHPRPRGHREPAGLVHRRGFQPDGAAGFAVGGAVAAGCELRRPGRGRRRVRLDARHRPGR